MIDLEEVYNQKLTSKKSVYFILFLRIESERGGKCIKDVPECVVRVCASPRTARKKLP